VADVAVADVAVADIAVVMASFMMRRMVRAHRPHCGLQPRQSYTWPVVRGAALGVDSVARTSWSVSTLQEQTIIAGNARRRIGAI